MGMMFGTIPIEQVEDIFGEDGMRVIEEEVPLEIIKGHHATIAWEVGGTKTTQSVKILFRH